MRYKDVQNLVTKWQKILRLTDWEIDTEIVKLSDHFESYGSIEIIPNLKKAYLKILNPDQWEAISPHEEFTLIGLEETIVHELLHLHIDPFWETEEGSISDILKEQAINIIASALIEKN